MLLENMEKREAAFLCSLSNKDQALHIWREKCERVHASAECCHANGTGMSRKQFSTALSAVANVGKVWCACGCAPFPVGGSLVLECILLPQLLCVTSFCESFF